MQRKLNLGSGDTPLDGYDNIDIKQGRVAYPLDTIETGSVDEVRASHLLEHFTRAEQLPILKEWSRVLKPGGLLQIAVPDFDRIVGAYQRPNAGANPLEMYLMGGQTDAVDQHKVIYNPGKLRALLKAAGLLRVEPWKSEVKDAAALPISLNLQARKPTAEQGRDVRIAAVLSAPRFGINEVWATWYETFGKLHIPMALGSGAFWGQVLERVMTEAMPRVDWIITCDYDTPANEAVVAELLYLVTSYPEIDALAPVQQHRGNDSPLFCIYEDFETRKLRTQITREELSRDILPVSTAHFGLTMIRTSALAKMAHPWFLGQPNSNGTWGDGRIDDDIYFWRKFAQAGNKLAIAPHVVVGHVETAVMFPGENFGAPVWSTMKQYKDGGWCPPLGAWK